MARDVLKNINAFVNGVGFAGQVEDYNPPKQTLQTEDFKGGGMFAPLELTMGLEKLECDFSIISYDEGVLGDFTIVEGQQVSFTFRGFLESYDGTTNSVTHIISGKIKELDRGTWKSGEKSTLKISIAASYFQEMRGAVVITEIDVQNMIYISNGTDLLQAARNALGM
jgi:P2 family phage contractile tail tube protein